jgi:hypothetical protein
MADENPELKKKRTFRKFTFRGVDLEALLDVSSEEVSQFLFFFFYIKWDRNSYLFFFSALFGIVTLSFLYILHVSSHIPGVQVGGSVLHVLLISHLILM